MAEKQKTRGLGRGLSALMADVTQDQTTAEQARHPDMMVPIEKIRPNPDQPRRHFDEIALDELAASIREKGVIQPLIVRRDPKQEGYFEIVAGERRWRASQIAKLHELPVLIREYSDTEVLEVAIIENIQRADLNAIDEAAGYRQLMDRFGHTQEQLASALGKSRSHIANLMRLLSLPADVQELLTTGQLTAGHARTLVGNEHASSLAKQIMLKGMSVRDAESLVRKPGKTPATKAARKPGKDADTLQIESELSAALRMPVSIDHDTQGEGGRIALRYRDLEQLDDLLRLLSGN
ncbi:ParB/RepB/Spo0J family partition protein [Limimaricola hongkongensis]|uniref:Chromosome (Plasmid) partitioning protein ParB / Stage 0 sporulation protein J n=1 Tax=Limimaricola hongkongensis DSM 17492 TaxID=1122180 RepID=A0A017HH97_9RHOB|nr:ParB/RepB/Spo0J family partition protein [Limimaricola hongkongensis]EYD73159.1 Chromosome (plasmid) partitioning protein ParB / Stage 0 sporulation protein J [Limimaricola hongkongensis DSM 17492]